MYILSFSTPIFGDKIKPLYSNVKLPTYNGFHSNIRGLLTPTCSLGSPS